jgi:type IV pilus biogenesis/stability protein PilW
MLQEEAGRTHVDARSEQIVALYESTNQPHIQPTGRTAQAAQAAVVGLSEGERYRVLVALTLTQSGETVIYGEEPVTEIDLSQSVEEALNFAESMGFILDSTGWQNLDEAHREELLARLPAFRSGAAVVKKEAAKVERVKPLDPLAAVARLFAAFGLLLALLLAACSGPSGEQRAKSAEIHYDLGTNLLNAGDSQGALKEYLDALESDPDLPDVHNGLGIIYAYSLQRPLDAEKEFQRALELKPDFSEARTNLGALYLSRGRYAEAIPPLEKSAADPLYKTRVLAQSDLAWALYKTGATDRAIVQLKAALQLSPKYCLGWRQLGTIDAEKNRLEEAREAFAQYASSCPDVADAHLQSGKVLARLSRAKEAQAEFQLCAASKGDKDKVAISECARFLRGLGAP